MQTEAVVFIPSRQLEGPLSPEPPLPTLRERGRRFPRQPALGGVGSLAPSSPLPPLFLVAQGTAGQRPPVLRALIGCSGRSLIGCGGRLAGWWL